MGGTRRKRLRLIKIEAATAGDRLHQVAHQHLGLGRGGQGERADEREQRRGGQRAGGAEEAPPRAVEALCLHGSRLLMCKAVGGFHLARRRASCRHAACRADPIRHAGLLRS